MPSHVTMLNDNAEEQDVTEYFSYDEIVRTHIIEEEFINTLENGYHHFMIYYDDDTIEEFGFHVEDELINNVQAIYAFRGDSINNRIYNVLDNVQDISLYYSNIGDNRIVDVLKCNGGSVLGIIDPDDYTIAPAGNKVTLKKEYLQTLEPNTKMEYGVRLADGTIIYEDWHYFWTIKNEWVGCVVKDVQDYSLSEGGDYVINLIRNKTDKIFSYTITPSNWEEKIKYAEGVDLDFGGYDHYVIGGNTITVPEEMMKKIPVDKELNLSISYCFDYSRKIYSFENVRFKVIP